jgi:release factor glutamine methyltransferase
MNAIESILFKAVIKRRARHEPFQYIVGKQEFFGLEFEVTPDVLIPRPETETLIEDVIQEYEGSAPFRFCEIGVGSGCIVIALLKNLLQATAVGVDVSEAAIGVSTRNAEKNGVADRLELIQGNLFDRIHGASFDLIVSNPPYVPEPDLETLQQEVKNFEPRLALAGGTDGLDIVRSIVADSPQHLNSKGCLFIEVGWDQSERVAALFDMNVWAAVDFLPDLQGIPRIVKAKLN